MVGICRSCKEYHDVVGSCSRLSRRRKARGAVCCWYCGASGYLTRDHATSRARGGTDDPENILPACQPCNQRKGSLDLERYRWVMQFDTPDHDNFIFFGEQFPEQVWPKGRLASN